MGPSHRMATLLLLLMHNTQLGRGTPLLGSCLASTQACDYKKRMQWQVRGLGTQGQASGLMMLLRGWGWYCRFHPHAPFISHQQLTTAQGPASTRAPCSTPCCSIPAISKDDCSWGTTRSKAKAWDITFPDPLHPCFCTNFQRLWCCQASQGIRGFPFHLECG